MTPAEGLLVASTAEWIMEQAQHVTIDDKALEAAAEQLMGELEAVRDNAAHGWDKELHFYDGGPHTLQYLLVLDGLNFCFWPDEELEYDALAGGLKASMLEDITCLDAEKLAHIDGPGVRQLVRWGRDLPQQEERARLLREIGAGLLRHFGGRAAALVGAARGSAVALVELLASHFPGFRDHGVYRGRQVFFYKRAQIFAADVYGAFEGRGLGAFTDADKLTCFADYRVPVVLRVMGVLRYSDALAAKVDARQAIEAGSEEEAEIRAATIAAVERLRAAAAARDAAARRKAREAADGAAEAAAAEAKAAAEAAEGAAKGGEGGAAREAGLSDAAAAVAEGKEEGGSAGSGAAGSSDPADSGEGSSGDAGAGTGSGASPEELRQKAAAAAAAAADAAAAAAKARRAEEEAGKLLSIHIDWWLWGVGERARKEHPPHHRTLTIYY